MMRNTILAFVLLSAWTHAAADDLKDAEAKVREYFDVFTDKDIDAIVGRIYSMPVHVGNSSGHRAYVTEDDARTSLKGLYETIEGQGWVRSVISNVDACAVTDGVVFAEVTYTRDKADGTAIAPGLAQQRLRAAEARAGLADHGVLQPRYGQGLFLRRPLARG